MIRRLAWTNNFLQASLVHSHSRTNMYACARLHSLVIYIYTYICIIYIYKTLYETLSINVETGKVYRYCMYIKCHYLSSQCNFVIKNVYFVLVSGKANMHLKIRVFQEVTPILQVKISRRFIRNAGNRSSNDTSCNYRNRELSATLL